MLKQLILEDIDDFLKELGHGFTYVENEYPIKLGNRYNYIDLLLFNIKDINQNSTIGIIICKKGNKFVMEYVTNKNIIDREYELI